MSTLDWKQTMETPIYIVELIDYRKATDNWPLAASCLHLHLTNTTSVCLHKINPVYARIPKQSRKTGNQPNPPVTYGQSGHCSTKGT